MLALKPNILERDGKKEFVILTYEEYSRIQEALEDAEDLCCLREAKEDEYQAPTVSLDSVRHALNI
jgi:PHD/YefM family antitoxin component YafN of YafNO toxin-antitoxin module